MYVLRCMINEFLSNGYFKQKVCFMYVVWIFTNSCDVVPGVDNLTKPWAPDTVTDGG